MIRIMTEKEYRALNLLRRQENKRKRPKCKICLHGKPGHGQKHCIARTENGVCNCKAR
jgi:hypothetical protein